MSSVLTADAPLTTEELAAMLKVSVKSVRLWIAEGQIRAVRLPGGRRLRIPVEEAYRLMGKGEPEEVPAR